MKGHEDTVFQPLNVDSTADRNPMTAIISDVKPLLLPDSRDESDVQAMLEGRPTSVVAVIDERGRSKAEVRNIRAELLKFGNRTLGAVTYCTTRQSLQKLFDDNSKIPDYFPIGILRQLNGMHGHTNFDVSSETSDICSTLPGDSALMVVGAHVAHPFSDASQHCPSVAAVVANIDQNLTLYPGSVRLRPSTRSITKRNGRLRSLAEPQILDLPDHDGRANLCVG
jgi:hypothetical protein